MPSDQQSFLSNPVISVLVCLRCDKKPPPIPTKSSGKKEEWKGGLSRGVNFFIYFNFFFLKKKHKVLITRVSAENDLVRRSQALHSAESDLRQTGGEFPPTCSIAHVEKCALWIPSDFAVPAGREFRVSYFSVLTETSSAKEVPCCRCQFAGFRR